MNILLINPIINIFPKPGISYSDQPPVPLGIFYLAAVAEAAGHKVSVKNLHSSTACRYIRRLKPDLIGITCSTPQYPQALKIAAAAKQAAPGVTILLGGYFPTCKWESVLSETRLFDYLAIGEGEETFKAFLAAFPDRAALEALPGLAYRDSQGKPTFTGLRPLIPDLDSIPFPARHLSGYPIPTVITSRGCPHNCRFCTIKNFYRRKFRQRKVEKVAEEILSLKTAGYRTIHIRDDNFCISKDYVLKFRDLIAAMGLNDLSFTINGDLKILMDDEVLQALQEINVKVIRLGIQSTNLEARQYLNLFFDFDLVKAFFHKIQDYPFVIESFFILNSGMPEETMATITRNIEDFFALLAQHSGFRAVLCASAFMLEPFPGTDTESDFQARGIALPSDWKLCRPAFCDYEYNDVKAETLEPLYEKVLERSQDFNARPVWLARLKRKLYFLKLAATIALSELSLERRIVMSLHCLYLGLVRHQSAHAIRKLFIRKYF